VERGFLGSWRGFGEGAGSKDPVTEPKRCQNPKRPLSPFFNHTATSFLNRSNLREVLTRLPHLTNHQIKDITPAAMAAPNKQALLQAAS